MALITKTGTSYNKINLQQLKLFILMIIIILLHYYVTYSVSVDMYFYEYEILFINKYLIISLVGIFIFKELLYIKTISHNEVLLMFFYLLVFLNITILFFSITQFILAATNVGDYFINLKNIKIIYKFSHEYKISFITDYAHAVLQKKLLVEDITQTQYNGLKEYFVTVYFYLPLDTMSIASLCNNIDTIILFYITFEEDIKNTYDYVNTLYEKDLYINSVYRKLVTFFMVLGCVLSSYKAIFSLTEVIIPNFYLDLLFYFYHNYYTEKGITFILTYISNHVNPIGIPVTRVLAEQLWPLFLTHFGPRFIIKLDLNGYFALSEGIVANIPANLLLECPFI